MHTITMSVVSWENNLNMKPLGGIWPFICFIEDAYLLLNERDVNGRNVWMDGRFSKKKTSAVGLQIQPDGV